MNLGKIFSKDLFRNINGVVKAEQQDQAIIWQELDEYVITRELLTHLEKFFKVYLKSVDTPNAPGVSGQMGVWVSGFFGSGKSHFIKILSYLLENREVSQSDSEVPRKAISFFEEKLDDPLFVGDIKRAISSNTDVILFNIDTKADHKEGRDAILTVFLRVFNEMRGFSGDYPHIASMESYLSEKGKLDDFHQAFKELDGSDWLEERDAHLFKESQVVGALSKALNISEQDAQNWFEKAENQQSLTIENFAKQVKTYLGQKGKNHRILFLVDEVGQFIGDESPLMLNLQTITENLGTACGGQAWVVVTSQEDIDAILGDFKKSKEQDFSKIQGRFTTRLSLSSSNTDEVIQKRLLSKTDDAEQALKSLYAEKGDILKNQLSFLNTGASFKNYQDSDNFVATYPFVPYHFQLIQKVFESIRKAGATGKHLSRGERSMLDAFQLAAQTVADQPIGTLIPLYQFYPAIEGFLDTSVSRAIKQAEERPLEEFDIQLLKVLFLIRYVDIMKPNVNNLVTLCIEQVDEDRLQLRQKIEKSLQRLEKETLISQSGDLYFFLTNEEQDVTREIKMVSLEGNEDIQEISRLLFEEVLKGNNKYRYSGNKTDYSFVRLCDGHPWKGRLDQELILEIITPLSDDYDWYTPEKCITRSLQDEGRAIIKIDNPLELGRELRTWLQTNKYIRTKSDSSAPATLQRILRDRGEENRDRQRRLIEQIHTLLHEAEYYAIGKSLKMKTPNAQSCVDEAIGYLLQNLFSKLGYLTKTHANPQEEIKAILRISDTEQMDLVQEEKVDHALDEVHRYIQLKNDQNHRLLLSEVIDYFTRRPYGWPEWEIVILVARLATSHAINQTQGTSPLTLEEAQEFFCKTAKWKLVTLHKSRVVDKVTLEKSRKLGQKLFGQIGPDSEKDLYAFLQKQLNLWKQTLLEYRSLASTEQYPGAESISDCIKLIDPFIKMNDSSLFIEEFNQRANALRDSGDDIYDLKDFYENQRPMWEKLRDAGKNFNENRAALQKDQTAARTLDRMKEILNAKSPYSLLKEIDGLIATITPINQQVIQKRQEESDHHIQLMEEHVKNRLDEVKADADLQNKALKPLKDIRKQIQQETSIPHITEITKELGADTVQDSLDLINKAVTPDLIKPNKPIQNIKVSQFSAIYLETEEEVETFLDKLKQDILKAIHNEKRVRLS